MLVPRLYEDLSVLHQNTMPVHSYFIPTSTPPRTLSVLPPREDSDRLQMLSGIAWNFRYYSSIHELREAFYLPDFKPDDAWKEEVVPFCWQMKGYDEHQYTNIRFPFPFDPPYVPQHNPCGAYTHTFTWHKDPDAPCTFLFFEGVDSCFYVWLNGNYVGYSQVSHYVSEFDVTDYLTEGENHLAVLVLKWCDGSYLEDQDKFRMSGIIRDVYLLNRPKNRITDYVITTDLSEDLHTADLSIKFTFSGEPIPVSLKLLENPESGSNDSETSTTGSADSKTPETGSAARTILEASLSGESEIHLGVKDPLLWNAETPNLYTLIIGTEHETITERVGFRSVCLKDGVVYLNGAPIKFRGVNRHESDPITGEVQSRSRIEQDLYMIKKYNFNAVRASHYPNVPYFYQICDELGYYVIDEADNESHGTGPLSYNEDDYNERMRLAHVRIADNPDFIEPTLDRVRSMVLVNRNRPCILVWSMGNECGYGCTFEESLKWTKTVDPTRLTTYESAYYAAFDREYDMSNIDLYGRMYPPFSDVTDYLADDPEKPLLLVEYCHSMGNGPGDFKEYRDLIEKYPRLCGGFVWEWCDHAIYKGVAENGKAMYWYGGDHGELQHDENFCLDGLVYPDRTPHTGLLEFKNVHRPLRASYDADEGALTVESFLDFLDLSPYVRADYSLTLDGDEIANGSLSLPPVPPHECAKVPLSLEIPEKGRCFLCVTYVLTNPLQGLPAGHELGFDDIEIRTSDQRNQTAAAMFPFANAETTASSSANAETTASSSANAGSETASASLPEVTETGTDLVIEGSNFTYTLDTLSGRFTSLVKNGREILTKPVDFNLWRAPTDNDTPIMERWKFERLDHTVTRAYSVDWENTADAVVVRIRQSVAAMSVQPILRIEAICSIYPDGSIRMEIAAEKDREFLTLPRIGLRLFLDPALGEVTYYGIGPHESYIDKCRSGKHGTYQSSVADLLEDYIRPQENGSHTGCDYVRLEGDGLTFTVATGDENTFSFNASVYTQEELETKRHNYELTPCGSTVLCIDHKMAGIGSKSCGPDLSEEYRVDTDNYNFVFLIKL
ncbi:MAG: DUF4981 domain-containing protein [Lachnospiraceae bacterium]|nr:DUF4981 domain-containing protein [Lachnospiraceae bacterium]